MKKVQYKVLKPQNRIIDNMKIPISELRLSLEKSADQTTAKTVRGALGIGISKALKTMGRHPFITAGVIGGAMATTALADKILSVYHIANEERKRRIMLGQSKLLSDISNNQMRQSVNSIQQKVYQSPLQY